MKTVSCVFGTGVLAYDKEPVFKSEMLVWNGRYYLIGTEHKEFTADKMQDEDDACRRRTGTERSRHPHG